MEENNVVFVQKQPPAVPLDAPKMTKQKNIEKGLVGPRPSVDTLGIYFSVDNGTVFLSKFFKKLVDEKNEFHETKECVTLSLVHKNLPNADSFSNILVSASLPKILMASRQNLVPLKDSLDYKKSFEIIHDRVLENWNIDLPVLSGNIYRLDVFIDLLLEYPISIYESAIRFLDSNWSNLNRYGEGSFEYFGWKERHKTDPDSSEHGLIGGPPKLVIYDKYNQMRLNYPDVDISFIDRNTLRIESRFIKSREVKSINVVPDDSINLEVNLKICGDLISRHAVGLLEYGFIARLKRFLPKLFSEKYFSNYITSQEPLSVLQALQNDFQDQKYWAQLFSDYSVSKNIADIGIREFTDFCVNLGVERKKVKAYVDRLRPQILMFSNPKTSVPLVNLLVELKEKIDERIWSVPNISNL